MAGKFRTDAGRPNRPGRGVLPVGATVLHRATVLHQGSGLLNVAARLLGREGDLWVPISGWNRTAGALPVTAAVQNGGGRAVQAALWCKTVAPVGPHLAGARRLRLEK